MGRRSWEQLPLVALLGKMDYYDTLAEGYTELHHEEQAAKVRIILAELKPRKGEVLLDVGCGPCSYRAMIPCRVVGVDPSLKLLEQAKDGKYIQGRAEDLPFKNRQFDYCISVTAIHHCIDIRKALKEMKRVTRKAIAISALMRSAKFNDIKKLINETLIVTKQIQDSHDMIFISFL
jgi:ubiquinone/menaquinone biosynthesis C-methylase UbiE